MRSTNHTTSLNARELYRFALVVGSCLLVLWLVRPLVPALTGVGLLAVATRRPYAFLLLRTRSRTGSALLGVAAVTLCIVAPVGLVLDWVAVNADQALAYVRTPSFWESLQRAANTANSFAASYGFKTTGANLPGALERALNFSASFVISLFTGSVAAFVQIIAMLFLLFFWYRDGDRMWRSTVQLAPFDRRELRLITRRVRNTVEGTVLGRLIVAVIQGVLAGATFWALGVPAASLLGFLTAVCAVLPTVGAYIVWVPVVVYLALLHAWGKAVILLLIGSAILSTLDNFLFPVIAGSRTQMATGPMFLAFVGGIWVFGLSGLILGPVIWSLAGCLILIEFAPDRARNGSIG